MTNLINRICKYSKCKQAYQYDTDNDPPQAGNFCSPECCNKDFQDRFPPAPGPFEKEDAMLYELANHVPFGFETLRAAYDSCSSFDVLLKAIELSETMGITDIGFCVQMELSRNAK